MQALLYNSTYKNCWDSFLETARNATFLFKRDFMDYHKDRFEDCSLLFLDEKGKIVGVMPANFRSAESLIESHGGLTYGGIIAQPSTSVLQTIEMFKSAASLYLKKGATYLNYKPTPHIYHKYPSDEDLYCLFRAHAQLVSRSISSTVDLTRPLPFSTLRRRKVKRAIDEKLEMGKGSGDQWNVFWDILSTVLLQNHQTSPVHTIEEIKRLSSLFPDKIQLYIVKKEEQILAGCVTFDCEEVIHIQYIASNQTGKELGALDFLFRQLVDLYKEKGKHYFDFGISTEQGGRFLNEGLIFQKEGFGGRAICYDNYQVDLNTVLQL